MKKRITVLTLVAIFICSCFLLISCEKIDDDVQRDTSATIVVEGASESRKLTVYATNDNTGEKIEIEVQKKNDYTSVKTLDYGNYTVNKVKSNNRDCEIDIITNRFSIDEGYVNSIVLKIEETDISGTLLWFWKNNAFTLIALVILSIAWVIVVWRKKRSLMNVGKREMQ